MGFLRRLYRFFALLIWLVITGFKAFPHRKGGWESIRAVSQIAKLWGAGIARILNMKIKINGDASDFNGGLIVSNHLGYLDIIAHAATFPLRFTPKSDIAKWPLLGSYLGMNRPVWVDRSSRQKSQQMAEDFKETMSHGINLIVYPEGTSTSGKEGILPFKSTPFEAVAVGDFKILPVLTFYYEKPGEKPLAWYGGMTLVPHLWRITALPEIEVELYILPPIAPEGRDRKELAEYVHGVMEKEYFRIFEKLNEQTCA
jgi:1-acyl-sn-glycerol-3-phosphate acyltransferase